MVNIAVFATFHSVIRAGCRTDAGFKPCDAIRQRDVARYGWQKRQDRGKKRQGQRQKRQGFARMRPHPGQQMRGCVRRRLDYLPLYAIVQVPTRPGGLACIELIYYEEGAMSRC
jgi:hypothetical protein